MEEKRIPQAWIGRDVLLCRRGAANSELGTLQEVSELGFAYTHRAGEVTEPIFVPWSAVSRVRPSVPEDLANPGTEAEQANPVSQIRPPYRRTGKADRRRPADPAGAGLISKPG